MFSYKNVNCVCTKNSLTFLVVRRRKDPDVLANMRVDKFWFGKEHLFKPKFQF